LIGKSFLEKCRLIPKLTGTYTAKDWSLKDQNVVKRILEGINPKLPPKGYSTVFYERLYTTNTPVYKKVCSLTRCAKFFNSLECVIKALLNPVFCKVCCECLCHTDTPICYRCSKEFPDRRKELISSTRSKVVKQIWDTPGYKSQHAKNMRRKFGVSNVFQLESVKQKRINSLKENLGDNWQQKLIQKKNKTVRKTYGVECVLSLGWVREKAKKTLVAKLGVDHQMKDKDTFLRMLSSSRYIYSGRVNGRKFKVQGKSEIQLAKRLCDKFGTKNVHSQFHKEYPDYAYETLGTFPDFYISSLDTFVECKSTWTFMGRGLDYTQYSEGDLTANMTKARFSNESGEKVRWVIHHCNKKTKQHHFLKLPLHWYDLDPMAVRNLVTNFIKENS
jgi:hypothetical protein